MENAAQLTSNAEQKKNMNKKKKFLKDQKGFFLSTASVFVALLIWEIISRTRIVDPLFISSPTEIAKAASQMVFESTFWYDLGISGYEFIVGFTLAVLFGIPFGIFSGWNKTFYHLFNPYISALYMTPRVAFMPVIIIAFGIGPASKIVVVFLMSIFPIIINAQKAMNTLDQNLVKAARAFTATEWQIFKTVALPSTVPFLITGIRLGIGQGLIGVVVGELFASMAGIGFQLTNAGQNLQTDRMFVGVLVITVLGVVLTSLVEIVEKHFSSWRPEKDR
ncbi:ABC transporter permease [Brevibacillus sp. B_LB10_24]|uniref:ABC transporter permease n=1 Tax=Brevibacillus sp. B_LB10_24 TaxID=3380645 RepID=UPI0038BDA44B